MSNMRDIKTLTHDELEEHIVNLGYPRYRASQIEDWLYKRGVSIISKIDNVPKDLLVQLENDFYIGGLELVTRQEASDGTCKYLFKLYDGLLVEAVGIPSSDKTRLTVCFSSQVGCPMGCAFCATGKSGFARNLTSGEMYDQVKFVGDDFGVRVTNAVCMGQGEPFLNYDAVLEALRRINSKTLLGVGARHITVSTCGILKGIERFMMEPQQFTLAVSLHSAIQESRDEIMPGVQDVLLADLKESIRTYGDTTKRRPTLEYAPIQGINDDDEHINALVNFCKGMLCHVNLIPLNPIDSDALNNVDCRPSLRMDAFIKALNNNSIDNSVRKSRGKEIDGACGQLRQRHESTMS